MNRWNGTYVNGIEAGFDFDAHYTEANNRCAVAWVALGWEPVPNIIFDEDTGCEWQDEDEPMRPDFGGRIAFRMVGDDHVSYFDMDDMVKIEDDTYCAECGQIGCTHDGREREDS